MGCFTSKIDWETLRVVNAGTFTGTYVPLGGPLLFPSYIAKLVNDSTSLVTISIDGVKDVDVAPPSSFWLYDEGKGQPPYQVLLPKGTQIYVKGAVGTGMVYFVSQYIVQA